jgi:hypothetical protein
MLVSGGIHIPMTKKKSHHYPGRGTRACASQQVKILTHALERKRKVIDLKNQVALKKDSHSKADQSVFNQVFGALSHQKKSLEDIRPEQKVLAILKIQNLHNQTLCLDDVCKIIGWLQILDKRFLELLSIDFTEEWEQSSNFRIFWDAFNSQGGKGRANGLLHGYIRKLIQLLEMMESKDFQNQKNITRIYGEFKIIFEAIMALELAKTNLK